MGKITAYAIRQKGAYSKYCYFQEIGRYIHKDKIHGWTKKLSEASFFSAQAAINVVSKLQYNSPCVIQVVFNENDKIIRSSKISRPKLLRLATFA